MGAYLGNPGEGSYAEGLCVEEGFRMGVSLYRGPIGGLGRGNFERWMKRAVGMGLSLSEVAYCGGP
jgi:hypothetical protein